MKEHLNRIALVTGGSSGIGRGAAIELARNGSAVAIHGRDLAEAESVAQLILDFGGRAIAFAGEIQDEDQVRELVRNVVECFGGINTLVTSAGIQRYGSAVDTDVLTWDEVFNVNVKGAFLAAKYSLPYLRESPAGSIAIVASAQATATQPNVVAYTASKGALVSLARAMAVDEGPRGVRVNSISPGSVDTPMLRQSALALSDGSESGTEEILRNWGSSHPLGRIAEIKEIGEVISFITSPRASFLTGVDIRVDGGLAAKLPAPMPKS